MLANLAPATRFVCALSLLVGIAATGCSAAPSIAWRPEMARWFGERVRTLRWPRSYFSREEEVLLLKRIGYADVAAVGKIHAVSRARRFGLTLQVTVEFAPDELLHGRLDGELDDQGLLPLRISAKSPDFVFVQQASSDLPGRRLLLLLKRKPHRASSRRPPTGWRASLWFPRPVSKPDYVWYFYRPDHELVENLRTLYRDLHRR